MLTLLQATLLRADGHEFDWFEAMAGIVAGFIACLKWPAREAAAAVLLQPFLTQLLPASIAAAEAASQPAGGISNAARQRLQASAGQTGAEHVAAASAGAPQQTSAELEPCLDNVTYALHGLLCTGLHQQHSITITRCFVIIPDILTFDTRSTRAC